MAVEGAARAAIAPPAARWPSRRRLLVGGLCAAFVLGAGIAGLLLDTTTSDLDLFFWPSAEIAAHGHPLLVYAVRADLYPNANGPLALVPLTAVAALSNLLGIAGSMPLRDGLTEAVFATFSLLMAHEALLAVEAGERRRGPRLAVAGLFLALPALWVATIGFGHVEAPLELWLLLLGIRLLAGGATIRAGLCLGLAALTRSLALVVLVPVFLTLLGERRWRQTAMLAAVSALVAVAAILPFFLADRADLVYSLFTFRTAVPVAGGSLWFAFRAAPWIGVVRTGDAWIFTAAAALLSVALISLRGRGGRVRATPAAGADSAAASLARLDGLEVGRIVPLLAIASLCAPMLAKTAWPYYLLDPSVFVTVWWLAHPGRLLSWRLMPPAGMVVGSGVLGTVEQHLPLAALPGMIAGVTTSAALAAIAAAIFTDTLSGPPRGRRRRTPPGLDSPGC